jgi:hypothetical protein
MQTDPTNQPWSDPRQAGGLGVGPAPEWATSTGPAPRPPKKAHPVRRLLVGLALLLFAGVIVSAVASRQDPNDPPESAATASTGSAGSVTPTPQTYGAPGASQAVVADSGTGGADDAMPGDGDFEVGEQVQPGKYRSAGPADGVSGMCFWFRIRPSVDDPIRQVIASNGTKGAAIVTIKTGEIFRTSGCQEWHKA